MGRMSSYGNPAADYVEDRINLNTLFIHHPSATSLIDHGGLTYVVDAAITPCDGDTLLFGEQGTAKLMVGCIVTPDG